MASRRILNYGGGTRCGKMSAIPFRAFFKLRCLSLESRIRHGMSAYFHFFSFCFGRVPHMFKGANHKLSYAFKGANHKLFCTFNCAKKNNGVKLMYVSGSYALKNSSDRLKGANHKFPCMLNGANHTFSHPFVFSVFALWR